MFRVLFTLMLLLSVGSARANPVLPDKVLWAWQRAEDLSFIDPQKFGVAYMAARAVITGDEVKFQWRNQPLKVPPGTVMVATLRIDVDHRHYCAYSESQIKKLTNVVAGILARRPQTAQVQIDFDAVASERDFYRNLIQTVAAKLPPAMPLSITALASWCLFDDWIFDLPVAESVPMMFSLGPDREKVLNYFRSDRDFRLRRCCNSLGVSLEESDIIQLMIPVVQQRKMPCRVYVFTKSAWTAKKVKVVEELLGAM
jgi:hypothetical protein